MIQQADIDAEPLYAEAKPLLDKVLAAINLMRRSEGDRITEMLESRCADIANIAQSVRQRMPEVLSATRAKQKERIEKLDLDANPERLEMEIALVSQKLDVDEELDRLESHLSKSTLR